MDTLFVAGLSHRTAPLEVREQLALEEDKLREVLGDVGARGVAGELMILSTCNRVEVTGVAPVPGEARTVAFRHLGAARGVALHGLEPLLYTHVGAEAVRHVFRVAASLDSMVLGEPQILGQVKDAFALAQSCRTAGPVLHALMMQAFRVAKRVRTETDLGRHAVSVPYAGVELARKIFDSLEGKAVLLVGAGEMGALAARHLADQGALPIYVANRTAARAQDLAASLGGVAVSLDALETTLPLVDVVVACTGAAEPVLSTALVARALPARRGRALLLVDLGVPRNIEPSVDRLDGVFCYDVDDLQGVVQANLRERQRAVPAAEALIEREVATFQARLADLEVTPTIVSLREKLEAIRRAELERALARLPDAPDGTRQVMDAMSQAIVNKIVHGPIVKLKDSSRAGHGRRLTELISELFGLRRAGPDEDGST